MSLKKGPYTNLRRLISEMRGARHKQPPNSSLIHCPGIAVHTATSATSFKSYTHAVCLTKTILAGQKKNTFLNGFLHIN